MWEENADTLRLFLVELQTQWRVDGMSGRVLGLDYPGVEAALRLLGTPRRDRRELFLDLQAMERAALPVLNRRAG